MTGYYDVDGNAIDQPEALRLMGEERHVLETHMGEWWVSTVHLVIDHSHGDGPPVIFETMVFVGWDDFNEVYCDRYSTLREAMTGHDVAVAWVRSHLGELDAMTGDDESALSVHPGYTSERSEEQRGVVPDGPTPTVREGVEGVVPDGPPPDRQGGAAR